MSLDLELNLPCGSLNHNIFSKSTTEKNSRTMINKKSSNSPPPPASTHFFRSLTTIRKNTIDIEAADEAAEMVATACKRCHMLVMLCKSSPTCPNCKYEHPPCQSPLDHHVHLTTLGEHCLPRNGLVILKIPMRATWSDDHKGEGSALFTLS